MKLVVVTILLFAAALPARAAASTRIVGGTGAGEGAYPAQAELDITVGQDEYLCGGTLVAPQWVLTAGHCATDENTGGLFSAADYTVRLGSTELGSGTPFTLDAISLAPGYQAETQASDAALLHLASAAPETPLTLSASAASTGETARVLGWGTTSEGGQVSPTLQAVDVPVVSSAICRRAYGAALATTAICAGYPEGGRDACQGDSGGPLMIASGSTWTLAGVVSGGDGCARAGRYGIYTNMADADLRNWFTATTGIAAPVAGATASASITPVTAAAAAVRVADHCSRRACAFAVRFATSGRVRASVLITHGTARRLGLRRRTIATGSRRITTSEFSVLRLMLPTSLRARLKRHHLRSVRARFRVVATPSTGDAARSSSTVRLRK